MSNEKPQQDDLLALSDLERAAQFVEGMSKPALWRIIHSLEKKLKTLDRESNHNRARWLAVWKCHKEEREGRQALVADLKAWLEDERSLSDLRAIVAGHVDPPEPGPKERPPQTVE